MTKVERGTVTCPGNCNTDPLTLTLLEQTDTTYDSRRYPIRELTTLGRHRLPGHRPLASSTAAWPTAPRYG